jgi:Arylsulfotransferase (ASST)
MRQVRSNPTDPLAIVFRIAFVTGLGICFFFFGMATVYYKTFPYGMVLDAGRAAKTLGFFLFQPSEHAAFRSSAETGVQRHDPAQAFEGATLFTPHASRAFLIDMQGKVLHEWGVPFSAIWNETADVADPVPDDQVYWRDVELFPNGDLLVVLHASGDHTPYGYGLAKINKDSEVLWSYLGHVHHDVEVGEDGRVYAISQHIQEQSIDGLPELDPPILEETIVVLTPDGEKIKEVSVFEAVAKTPFRSTMRVAETDDYTGDYFHVNDVEPIGTATAQEWPFAEAGQVLVSIRDLNALAVMDLDDEAVVWLARGPWVLQHDSDILEDSKIMLFDNLGDFANGGRSRVLEFDPVTYEVTRRYGSTAEEQLFSPWAGSQQQLPNGNVLITEATKGRLVEVTPQGDVVWEYFSEMAEDGYAMHFMEAKRFARDELEFDLQH